MSTKARVSSAISGMPADFGTVLAHQPEMASRFAELYAHFWQQGRVSQRIKEITRIRNARITDCGF
jgi:hypothetical protein